MTLQGIPTSSRKAVGQAGEAMAGRYLEARHYQILARNWRAGRLGEIDLIALSPDGRILVFGEVKTRRSRTCGLPVEAVDERKCAQLLRVAQAYLDAHYADQPVPEVRFDVLSVFFGRTGPRVEHLENIFG